MYQKTIIKTIEHKQLLSLNTFNVSQLFPGFTLGDFAVLHGSQSVLSLSSLLCVRAQLPTQLGGLGSRVVFVDGGNSFKLYQIARLARLHKLDPKKILKKIHIARAFTAYQITTLVLEKLKETVNKYKAKLVIISDIAGFFLDKDVPEDEAYQVYSQVVAYLSRFAKENKIMLIVTFPSNAKTKREKILHDITCKRANVVIALNQSKYDREFVLEKHPKYVLGTADFPSEFMDLAQFSHITRKSQTKLLNYFKNN